MRSLQECQTEVFRRGKEIIRRRRKRTVGILLVCVPLTAGLMLLPFDNTKEEKLPEISLRQESANSAAEEPALVQIEISGNDGVLYITDERVMTELMGLLAPKKLQYAMADSATGSLEPECATEEPMEQQEIQGDGCDLSGDMAADEDNAAQRYEEETESYTFTLLMEDGTEAVYVLKGGVVTDLETGEENELTDVQNEKILAFIE